MKKILSVFLVAVMVSSVASLRSLADTASAADEGSNTVAWQGDEDDYGEYLNEISQLPSAVTDVTLNNENTTRLERGERISFTAEIPASSIYKIELYYRHFGESSNSIKFKLSIDGKCPFAACEDLALRRFWKNKSDEPQTDDQGNEYSSEQVAVEEFRSQFLTDEMGVVTEPYEFAFEAGTHIITLEISEGVIELEKAVLKAPATLLSYKDTKTQYDAEGYKWYDGEEPIVIEGEDAAVKNGKSIIAQSEKSSSNVTPSNPYKNVLNNIGGDNWATAGDSVVWKINVKESGVYKLNFRYQQRGVINGVTYRRLLVDGEVPFSEANVIAFPYTGWESKLFADDDGNPYGIYLEEGEHEIELVCTLGPVSELYKELKEIVSRIGDRYIQIIMITGESPDVNRDYELFKQIPDFTESLETDRKALLALAEKSEQLNGKDGNQAAASYRNMARVLENMTNNKYTAHKYVSDYYSNYNTISGWLSDMCSMPLSIDSVELCSEGYDCSKKVSGTIESIMFSVKRFFVSFLGDYSNSETEKKYDLRLWINWGRDQTQVLNSLIENNFTPKTGINVKLEIVSTSIINGILSGNAPDLLLQQSRSQPVNLAMRGALVDLSEFGDFEEVLGRFQEGAAEPYYYNGGCYAIPDTQSFMIMFYRKDVLASLELDVPETWDEFTEAAVKILRNNMQVSLPYTKMNGTAAADGGVGSLSLFPTLLIQNGVSIYNDEKNKCLLDSADSISVFADWTKLYTDYKVLKEANFYNRFRLGTMPLGIAQYSLYTQILTAAPEISDKWGIALIPGIEKSDGTVDHSISGAGSGVSILKISENKEAAWEFIKWWTDADTQYSYSENLECVLGPTGRVMTSNIEAFSQMSWSKADKQILLKQWSDVVEVPEVPGSYYLARSIDQAYWEVMNDKNTPKESLIKWTKVANAEIERKIKEYS